MRLVGAADAKKDEAWCWNSGDVGAVWYAD
jgi:hypothetical protein